MAREADRNDGAYRDQGARPSAAPDDANRDQITLLLQAWNQGDEDAVDQLWPRVYDELRRLAGSMMDGERRDHTLQPTALVHEAYVRLLEQNRVRWSNRGHFYAIAARIMRRILVDHARARSADKRGGGPNPVVFQDGREGASFEDPDLVEVDIALGELQRLHPRQALVVELRFFAGLTHREIASVLGCSTKTVQRHWVVARAWLYQHVNRGP
jgi:RNA polymerase sigma factor (TIGR02999 family)